MAQRGAGTSHDDSEMEEEGECFFLVHFFHFQQCQIRFSFRVSWCGCSDHIIVGSLLVLLKGH